MDGELDPTWAYLRVAIPAKLLASPLNIKEISENSLRNSNLQSDDRKKENQLAGITGYCSLDI